ncbi:hypothetical protein CASFOL_017476 [Castilleja foliolosa]|uniref:DUF8039 domain-containing protein n=1 Tax=Castilleja foliolosa TaxID=1961234 RepID=A0ABD3DCJ9_9LAMI
MDLLERKMMDEKIKTRREASQDPLEIIPLPSPPTRHEKWKRARMNTSGKYITPEVEMIAEKINSLEEAQSSGSFNASGTNDLLAVAIGKPDHPNRSPAPNDRMESEQQDERNDECELYVEDPKRRLVAYGQIHDLGSTVHNMKLNVDDVRVTVVRVIVEDALVPFPTDEVSTVGEEPNNFIVWPRRLIESVGRKGLSQKELFSKPKSQPNTEIDLLKRLWFAAADICQPKHGCIDAGVVSQKAVDVYITQEDIMGLLISRKISFPVMQLYNEYLYSTLRLSERNDKYGLISPLHGNSEKTLQKRIEEGDFECFLAPIYETNNWQLMVLCPNQNYVSWFCFKQNKPSKKISSRIETAFNAYQLLKGKHSRQLQKVKWGYPKVYKGDGDKCGLLVMRHMLEIIKLDTVDSFEKVFNMAVPYSDGDVDVVRRHWGDCFMEYYLDRFDPDPNV